MPVESDKRKELTPDPSPFKHLNWFHILLMAWVIMVVLDYVNQTRGTKELTYSEFLTYVDEGNIEEVTISHNKIHGKLRKTSPDEKQGKFVTIRVEDKNLSEKLYEKGVTIRGVIQDTFWKNVFVWLIPFILLFFFWRFLFGKMSQVSKQGGLFPVGKSKAKVYLETDLKTTFDDVAGVDEAKVELEEVVNFLKEPSRYARLGGRAPKGVLLVGPPGTGKTLIARAIAGEAKVPFLSINGSEFVEMFVGVGAARVRDLFEQARKIAPSIIFIDELDALGKSRALALGMSGNDEKEQTLNQLLAELDGFDSSGGVIILAATNRPEVLDPALLRAGRFDRQILIDRPDQKGREEILKVHMVKIKVAKNVDIEKVAAMTPGFSGADLENLCNEAALTATRRNAKAVEENDFTVAMERLVAGLERKGRVMNPEEKKRIAYHEMGHATVALALGGNEKVHKVSIIPRGIGALGYTLQRPTEDRFLMSQSELVGKIAVLLGGRTSEDIFFKDTSTGASDDLVKASDIARAMVTQYGMSDRLGVVSYEKESAPFLKQNGRGMGPQRAQLSEQTSQSIDQEVMDIVKKGQNLARELIKKNQSFLEKGAKTLLECETLTEEKILDLWNKYSGQQPKDQNTELSDCKH